MFRSLIGGVVSVGELCESIKVAIKSFFPHALSVYGEVSNLRVMPNSNAFFVLKDASGQQLNVTMFADKFLAQKTKLEDGRSFVVSGNVSLYDKRGEIRFIAASCEKVGLGHWQEKFEKLKQMFMHEGLFDSCRKKKLPILPQKIAVITSKDAAALQDFIKILKNKDWRGSVVVLHATVQGVDAVDSIVAALKKADADRSIELIVLTRGGGSLEDLWCFNEERLIREISKLRKPIISAVGHEVDYTLCDFVADKRAETPTAAAALIADEFVFYKNKCDGLTSSLLTCSANRMNNLFEKFYFFQKTIKLTNPRSKIEQLMRNIDYIVDRINSAACRLCKLNAQKAENYAKITHIANKMLDEKAAQFIDIDVEKMALGSIKKLESRFLELCRNLSILSVESNLKRGFVLPCDVNNSVIDDLRSVSAGEKVVLLHKYGKRAAVIN